MKFVINTNYKDAAGIVILEGVISRLEKTSHEVVKNDWGHYEQYDVALFTAPDSKVRTAKAKNPKLRAGIFDPKTSKRWQLEEARVADFLIVSSIEQRELFLKYNKNVFIYYMFPDIQAVPKLHSEKKKIIIGYHGNKQHLCAMKDVSWALDELAKEYTIEFRAIYNIKKLGVWTHGAPKRCPVAHVQWEESRVAVSLMDTDIGIVPSITPTSRFARLFGRPLRTFLFPFNREGYHHNDYVQRFKYSNNPGRAYVFAVLGIPVVTDFTPSLCQLIVDGKSGALVGTKEGWKEALRALIVSHTLRNTYSTELKKHIDTTCSIDHNFTKLLSSIESLHARQ